MSIFNLLIRTEKVGIPSNIFQYFKTFYEFVHLFELTIASSFIMSELTLFVWWGGGRRRVPDRVAVALRRNSLSRRVHRENVRLFLARWVPSTVDIGGQILIDALWMSFSLLEVGGLYYGSLCLLHLKILVLILN